jgi:hypothetical protein
MICQKMEIRGQSSALTSAPEGMELLKKLNAKKQEDYLHPKVT